MTAPTLVPQVASPAVAAAAVDDHLDRALRGRAPQEVGWERPDPQTLFVPMRAFTTDTELVTYGFNPATGGVQKTGSVAGDDYLLRLYFSHYPQSPPSAQFVNPATRSWNPSTDIRWLPMIANVNEVYVHANYDGRQLICCSSTLEFYDIKHDLDLKHQWGPNSTFVVLLNTLSRYMRRPHYTGRQNG